MPDDGMSLQQNGYPPGTKELTYDEAEKSSVPLRYYRMVAVA